MDTDNSDEKKYARALIASMAKEMRGKEMISKTPAELVNIIGVQPEGVYIKYYLKLPALSEIKSASKNFDEIFNVLLDSFPKNLEGSVFVVDFADSCEFPRWFLHSLVKELAVNRKVSMVAAARIPDKLAKIWNDGILWEHELTPAKSLNPFDPQSPFFDPFDKQSKAVKKNESSKEKSFAEKDHFTRKDLKLLANSSPAELVKLFERPGFVQRPEKFVPPFSPALYQKIFKNYGGKVGLATMTLPGALALTTLLQGTPLAEFALIAPASITAFGLALSGINIPNFIFAWKVRREINSIVSARLCLWLDVTYGIRVSSETTLKMSAAISKQFLNPQKDFSFVFESPALKGLALKADKDGFFVKGKKFDPFLTEALQSKMKKFQESDPLSASIQALVNEIADISEALARETITVESQHIKDRVEEDVTATLEMHAKLRRLEGAEVKKDNLVSIITALRDEMKQVLHSETQAVKKEMAIQEIYVKSRGSKSGIRLKGPTNSI